MKPSVRVVLFGLALATSLAVAWSVLRGHASPWLAAVWFVSLFPFALSTLEPRTEDRLRRSDVLLMLLAAVLPVLVRVANMDGNRMHSDEFITGYFSATHDFAHTNFFGFLPEYWEWQGQFPKVYFFLQRLFFAIFGTSTLSLRLSVQVYAAVVGVMLFLIAREMFGRPAGIIAVVLYSFLSISVYLETLGFFFIGATAAFTVFFYFALRQYRTGGMFPAAMSGIACGFCYLMYYSSYFAFPLLVVFAAMSWLRTRKIAALQNFCIALAGMLLVVAPFLAFIVREGDYALRRAKDMSLLTGLHSPHREAIAKGANPIPILRDNLLLDLRAFFRDGVAGGGGFDFGRLALFDRLSLLLFLAGLLAGLVLVFRKPEILLVFFVLGASLAAVVITVPPPTCHRFAIAFPFFALLMALPLSLLLRMPELPVSVRSALVAGLLLLFAGINERRFAEATLIDPPSDELRLSELINQRYDGRSLYVAAYDAFGFQKIFYFRDRWKNRRVETGFHANLLKKFNPNEKYVYVVTLADDFRKQFEKADPRGRFSRFSVGYSLFAN
jgi:4-amino-4-deoxy-L-arabinose transferase-like glycosyltransferase